MEVMSTLRRFVRPRKSESVERCELCSAEIPSRHSHLIEPKSRRILERTEAMSPEDLMKLHGTMRDVLRSEGKLL